MANVGSICGRRETLPALLLWSFAPTLQDRRKRALGYTLRGFGTHFVNNKRIVPTALGLILSVHVGLLAYSAAWQSPTLNEPGHLVAGLSHWRTGNFALYRVNPPMVRSIATLPVLLTDYDEDFSGFADYPGARSEFSMGEEFIQKNGRKSLWMFTLARWACIPFSILGAIICFAWARDLFGNASGLMAAALWCFSPMILGHASMIAPDAHATALGLAACYTFWRWLEKPTWEQAVLTGIVLGFAELSKTTLILFYPLWPVLWVLYRWMEWRGERRPSPALEGRLSHGESMDGRRRQWVREAGMLLLRMVVGLYVLNLGYLGEGSFTQLKDFTFTSEMLTGEENAGVQGGNRFAGSWVGELPMPFPANYLIGIDLQQRDFEKFYAPSYLRGVYQEKGWWYYYVYAFAVKAPLGTLGLIVLCVLRTLVGHGPKLDRRDAMILLAPAAAIFVIISSKTGFSHHSRYALPCVPFVFIWTSGLASCFQSKAANRYSLMQQVLTASLLAWSILSSLLVYPHSTSYFNELAGGPKHGPAYLLFSNVDWGQDLFFLERWIKQQSPSSADPVYLAFENYYSPFEFGIEGIESWPFQKGHVVSEPEISAGKYAISVNQLYESPWSLRNRDGSFGSIDPRPLAYLRQVEPIGRAGYSIRIFSAEQLRAAYAAPESPRLWDDH